MSTNYTAIYQIIHPDTNQSIGHGSCSMTWDGTEKGKDELRLKLLRDCMMPTHYPVESVRFLHLIKQ